MRGILALLALLVSSVAALTPQFRPVATVRPCVGALAPRAVVCACAQPQLTGGQRRQLRSLAGRQAAAKTLRYVSVASCARSRDEVDVQLASCELVRCKFIVTKKSEAKEMAAELAELTGAAVAEVLGHTALLYRPSEKRLIPLE